MATFKVVLERTDTITKQAEIVVEVANESEAQQQIRGDLEVDPGAYDDDLEPVEDGVGEITIRVESQNEERTQFPRAVAGGRH
jgi:5,10-methylene-tetrahydrofolate dehydrogenase/methenyl tetrahydrofolate cyclohydrolase